MFQVTFSQAIEGFMLAANARGLSENTIRDYSITYGKFQKYLKGSDPFIDEITADTVRKFLSLQYVSNKTLLNYHIGLSALWTWALKEELVDEHIIQKIQRPKPVPCKNLIQSILL